MSVIYLRCSTADSPLGSDLAVAVSFGNGEVGIAVDPAG